MTEDTTEDIWPEGTIDPDTVTPCPICGSLELWESQAWNPGVWRCMKCDPPAWKWKTEQGTRVAPVKSKGEN